MAKKVLHWLEYLQSLIDLHGGTWLALFTAAIIWRIVKGPALGPSEAAAYASAIGAFAYSNTNGPKGA